MSYPEDWHEEIDLTVEPWKTLAPLCWNCVSPSRLGALAEKHGVSENPYKKRNTSGLFEEGRQHHRDWAAAEKRFGAKLVTMDKPGADRAVLDSNDAKLVDGKPVILEGGKIGKPAGWTAPDLRGFV